MKVTVCVLLGVCLVLMMSGSGYAFKEGANESCIKCHTLEEKEMAPIFEKLNLQGARVLKIQPSQIKGLFEVALENKGRRSVLYVDFSKKYVTAGPLLDYANRRDLTRARVEELNKDRKVDLSKLSLDNALVVGHAGAPIRVVVFTDPG